MSAASAANQKQPAILGEYANRHTDVPISSVFLAIFAICAVLHMSRFQVNRNKGLFFPINAVTFGFCMSRIVTMSMRMAWAFHPENRSLLIAAQVFISAGVLLLWVVQLIFSQRIIRALHPTLAASSGYRTAFAIFYFCLFGCLVMVIAATVTTLTGQRTTSALKICSDIRKVGVTFFAITPVLPLALVPMAFLVPKRGSQQPLGKGDRNIKAKACFVILCSAILSFSMVFRCVTTFLPPKLASQNPWYMSKASLYCIVFVPEIFVVVAYFVGRIDQQFWISGKKERREQLKSANGTIDDEKLDIKV